MLKPLKEALIKDLKAQGYRFTSLRKITSDPVKNYVSVDIHSFVYKEDFTKYAYWEVFVPPAGEPLKRVVKVKEELFNLII